MRWRCQPARSPTTESPYPGISVSISITEPIMKAMTPPMPTTPKLGMNTSAIMKASPSTMSAQSGIVDGQHLQREQREQQRDRTDHSRQHESRIGKFEEQPENTRQHQKIGDARVGNHGQQPAAPIRLHGNDARSLISSVRSTPSTFTLRPSSLPQQVGHVTGDHVDDLELQRLVRSSGSPPGAPPARPIRYCGRASAPGCGYTRRHH